MRAGKKFAREMKRVQKEALQALDPMHDDGTHQHTHTPKRKQAPTTPHRACRQGAKKIFMSRKEI